MSEYPIRFRQATADDEALLIRIYASTRAEEMAMAVDWSDPQKTAFLEQQFRAQHTYYHQQWPEAAYQIILFEDEEIGRLYLDRRETEFRIMDIALLTKYRGKGIGGKIMEGILAEAKEAGKPVTIHVESNNPAMRLYHRLGFEKVEDQGVYHLMKWEPETSNKQC